MLKTVDFTSPSAPEQITQSFADFGFAAIENHPVAVADLEELYRTWDELFVSGEVQGYPSDAETQAGYFAPHQAETARGAEAQDLKEYFQYWVDGALPDAARTITVSYFDAVFSLATTVLTWIQETTSNKLWHSLQHPLGDCLSRDHTMLRILRYPPLSGIEAPDAIRAGAHEDINFITLLPTASQSGLEIKPKGSDWQPVETAPGTIVINIGDMLQELTAGMLPSTTHRVVNPEGNKAGLARLTAPVFCHPYPELVLSERYTAETYLNERLREINTAELRPV